MDMSHSNSCDDSKHQGINEDNLTELISHECLSVGEPALHTGDIPLKQLQVQESKPFPFGCSDLNKGGEIDVLGQSASDLTERKSQTSGDEQDIETVGRLSTPRSVELQGCFNSRSGSSLVVSFGQPLVDCIEYEVEVPSTPSTLPLEEITDDLNMDEELHTLDGMDLMTGFILGLNIDGSSKSSTKRKGLQNKENIPTVESPHNYNRETQHTDEIPHGMENTNQLQGNCLVNDIQSGSTAGATSNTSSQLENDTFAGNCNTYSQSKDIPTEKEQYDITESKPSQIQSLAELTRKTIALLKLSVGDTKPNLSEVYEALPDTQEELNGITIDQVTPVEDKCPQNVLVVQQMGNGSPDTAPQVPTVHYRRDPDHEDVHFTEPEATDIEGGKMTKVVDAEVDVYLQSDGTPEPWDPEILGVVEPEPQDNEEFDHSPMKRTMNSLNNEEFEPDSVKYNSQIVDDETSPPWDTEILGVMEPEPQDNEEFDHRQQSDSAKYNSQIVDDETSPPWNTEILGVMEPEPQDNEEFDHRQQSDSVKYNSQIVDDETSPPWNTEILGVMEPEPQDNEEFDHRQQSDSVKYNSQIVDDETSPPWNTEILGVMEPEPQDNEEFDHRQQSDSVKYNSQIVDDETSPPWNTEILGVMEPEPQDNEEFDHRQQSDSAKYNSQIVDDETSPPWNTEILGVVEPEPLDNEEFDHRQQSDSVKYNSQIVDDGQNTSSLMEVEFSVGDNASGTVPSETIKSICVDPGLHHAELNTNVQNHGSTPVPDKQFLQGKHSGQSQFNSGMITHAFREEDVRNIMAFIITATVENEGSTTGPETELQGYSQEDLFDEIDRVDEKNTDLVQEECQPETVKGIKSLDSETLTDILSKTESSQDENKPTKIASQNKRQAECDIPYLHSEGKRKDSDTDKLDATECFLKELDLSSELLRVDRPLVYDTCQCNTPESISSFISELARQVSAKLDIGIEQFSQDSLQDKEELSCPSSSEKNAIEDYINPCFVKASIILSQSQTSMLSQPLEDTTAHADFHQIERFNSRAAPEADLVHEVKPGHCKRKGESLEAHAGCKVQKLEEHHQTSMNCCLKGHNIIPDPQSGGEGGCVRRGASDGGEQELTGGSYVLHQMDQAVPCPSTETTPIKQRHLGANEELSLYGEPANREFKC